MARPSPTGETLGDALARRRRGRFVGREAELELFRAAVGSDEPPFSVLFVHGPGGIGKTSLLDAFAAMAAEVGWRTVRLDGRDAPQSLSAMSEALGGDVAATGERQPGATHSDRMLLLLDSYERLASFDDWVRTDFLPSLPASALTVIAGRRPPAEMWRADPAWQDLLRVVSLRNLTAEESRSYLELSGVDAALHGRLIGATYGHPLGLSLLADVVARGGDVSLDPLGPDVVGALLRRFVEVVPSELERRALGACALARVTTEPVLRVALDVEDAHEVFEWLRELSFVEAGPEGLFPHDLARDVLESDLRWRDPEAYRQVFRRLRAENTRALRSSTGKEQQSAIFDLKFLFRNIPNVLTPTDWDTWGRHYPEPHRADDRSAILALIRTAEGDESAAIAEHWLDRQPEGFLVIRDEQGGVRGVLTLLDLSAADAEDRAPDPGAQAAWDYAHRTAAPRPGEIVTQTRFVVDRDSYQDPSPTINAAPVVTLQRYLGTPNLAWDFLTLAEPERLDDFFALADLPRARGADFVVGGRRYGLFSHDFRQVPVDALMDLWVERGLAQDAKVTPNTTPEVLVLAQPDFADAVRQALRDLHRPDLLARNPLVGTRLVRARASSDPPDAAVLDGLVREAVDTLRRHPRDDKLLRAVETTYLRPTSTQEAAAAVLGLPFSTYRRHLTQGVSRVVAWLWDQEVYGPGH